MRFSKSSLQYLYNMETTNYRSLHSVLNMGKCMPFDAEDHCCTKIQKESLISVQDRESYDKPFGYSENKMPKAKDNLNLLNEKSLGQEMKDPSLIFEPDAVFRQNKSYQQKSFSLSQLSQNKSLTHKDRFLSNKEQYCHKMSPSVTSRSIKSTYLESIHFPSSETSGKEFQHGKESLKKHLHYTPFRPLLQLYNNLSFLQYAKLQEEMPHLLKTVFKYHEKQTARPIARSSQLTIFSQELKNKISLIIFQYLIQKKLKQSIFCYLKMRDKPNELWLVRNMESKIRQKRQQIITEIVIFYQQYQHVIEYKQAGEVPLEKNYDFLAELIIVKDILDTIQQIKRNFGRKACSRELKYNEEMLLSTISKLRQPKSLQLITNKLLDFVHRIFFKTQSRNKAVLLTLWDLAEDARFDIVGELEVICHKEFPEMLAKFISIKLNLFLLRTTYQNKFDKFLKKVIKNYHKLTPEALKQGLDKIFEEEQENTSQMISFSIFDKASNRSIADHRLSEIDCEEKYKKGPKRCPRKNTTESNSTRSLSSISNNTLILKKYKSLSLKMETDCFLKSKMENKPYSHFIASGCSSKALSS